MRVTIDALEVIDAIYRNGSFAAAANELHRVRSALTYTVQKLEQDLSIKIFEKDGSRAKLTAAGMTLLLEGQQLLKMASHLENSAKRCNDGWESELTIAYDDIIPFANLFNLIEDFYNECSGTQLRFSFEILGGCWDALLSKRADLAIGTTGDIPTGKNFSVQTLGQTQFVFVVAPQHPLASYPEPLKDSEISQYRAAVAADTSLQIPARSSGLLPGQEILRLPNLYCKLQAIKAGLGIGYMPLHWVNKAIQDGQLIIKEVTKKRPLSQLSIAWNIEKAGNAMNWLVKRLQDYKQKQALFADF